MKNSSMLCVPLGLMMCSFGMAEDLPVVNRMSG